jgi:hypothetical protein
VKTGGYLSCVFYQRRGQRTEEEVRSEELEVEEEEYGE